MLLFSLCFEWKHINFCSLHQICCRFIYYIVLACTFYICTFYSTSTIIWLNVCFAGESDVIGSDEPVKANVGEDVILPCHLEPPFNVSTLTVEWKRNKTYVHVYRSMKHDPNQQNTHFINRTYLFCDEIGKGNISLLLRNVSKEDEGLYICHVPKLHSQVRKGKIILKVGKHSWCNAYSKYLKKKYISLHFNKIKILFNRWSKTWYKTV